LTLPPDLDRKRKYPAILGSVYNNTVRNQWGGRIAHPTWGLDQYLVQKGYVLLNVDLRQSWVHGGQFRDGIKLGYGGIDVEDLHSGVDYLKTLGFVDADRVGIWGSSYGGLLTIMSLAKNPECTRRAWRARRPRTCGTPISARCA
jgi:dipeptidyl-peptidase-4